MFEPSDTPTVFGMPIGADFARSLAIELTRQYQGRSPEKLARVEIYVNTARMRRSLIEAFQDGPATLLPRIRLITDIAQDLVSDTVGQTSNDLRTKLELSQLVRALIEKQKTRAPKAAVFDLSDSLFSLMDEMHGEGIAPEKIYEIDVSDQSGHWQDSLEFIRILSPFFDSKSGASARQRFATAQKQLEWDESPPDHPIIVAGSTASRGATRLFMKAVANLPTGTVVLPGFDTDLPTSVWKNLSQEDHPQYRLKAFLDDLGLSRDDVEIWPNAAATAPERNRLLSLALRPAPVTSEWITEGPKLGPLSNAALGITLLEADSPRQEAETIALRMRKALDQGLFCALVTPDRMLTRQVSAALDRWDLMADDSAGTPLLLSAPGRLLAQLADWVGRDIPSHVLLSLLKHPLCNSSEGERGQHLLRTRELELFLRRHGTKSPNRKLLDAWKEREYKDNEKVGAWAKWLADFIEENQAAKSDDLTSLLDSLLGRAELFCAGPGKDGSGGLWLEAAGREAQRKCLELQQGAEAAGYVSLGDFAVIFRGVISDGVVRDRDTGRSDLLILGSLEARVQTADLVILGGLNEGSWPEATSPDPWLNRAMRKCVGLLLPERQIGLSAHDFQQAAGAAEVWFTRSKRTAEAETVPSRWLNRLTNLMQGLSKQNGPEALEMMRSRGDKWKAWADALSAPTKKVNPEERPSPCPPIAARPKELSVTRIKTLIRDPYSIYAEKVLRLRPLDPLMVEADAPLRGIIFHRILERFVDAQPDATDLNAIGTLIQIAHEELDEKCPWPSVKLRWLTQFEALAPTFVQDEAKRQAEGSIAGLELRGNAKLHQSDFSLTGVADRIDIDHYGKARIFDYKTGVVPTITQQKIFDKQLLLEAAMVTLGAFEKIDPVDVASAEFISIKPDMKSTPAPLDEHSPAQVWADFEKLILRWSSESAGYTARMAMVSKTDRSAYDHLSRFGEWGLDQAPTKVFLQ